MLKDLKTVFIKSLAYFLFGILSSCATNKELIKYPTIIIQGIETLKGPVQQMKRMEYDIEVPNLNLKPYSEREYILKMLRVYQFDDSKRIVFEGLYSNDNSLRTGNINRYNKRNLIVEKIYLNADSGWIGHSVYQYFDNDRRMEVRDSFVNVPEKYPVSTFSLNEHGDGVEQLDSLRPSWPCKYEYDSKGRMTKRIVYRPLDGGPLSGKLYYHTTYTLDKKGRTAIVTDSIEGVHIIKYEYDKDNNVTDISFSNSTRAYDEGIRFEYKNFDAYGNWTEKIIYSASTGISEGKITRQIIYFKE